MALSTLTNVGGYDHKFIGTPPDRLVCNICLFPSRDSHLSVCCGQLFCKSCLDGIRSVTTINDHGACPVCRDKEFVTFPNKQADREIRSLHVMCTNKERGCEWEGELNDISNHLGNSDGCQFEDVKCSNGCRKMLQRQHLTSHVETECPRRKVDCQYCHITLEHRLINGKHQKQCPKFPLPCPNKCVTKKIAREDMEAHRKECPLEMVQCEYHNVGCEERMMRKRKREHEKENMEDHLLMTKLKLAKTESKLEKNEERLNALEEVVNNKKTIASGYSSFHFSVLAYCPVTAKMSGYSEYKRDGIDWHSEPFYSSNQGYKLCLVVSPTDCDDEDHLHVFLFLMKGPYDDKLTWPLRENFEVKLLNQISNCEHRSDSEVVSYDGGTPDDVGRRVVDGERATKGWGGQFISNDLLHIVTPTCRYLKNDCIFLQVSKL